MASDGPAWGWRYRLQKRFEAKALVLREFPVGGRGQGFVFCPNDERLRALAVRGIRRGDESDTSVEITLPETPIFRP